MKKKSKDKMTKKEENNKSLKEKIELGCGKEFSIWNPEKEEYEEYGICRKFLLCPECERKLKIIKQAVKEFIEKNFYWEDGKLQANWVEWYDWKDRFKEIFGFNDSEVKGE